MESRGAASSVSRRSTHGGTRESTTLQRHERWRGRWDPEERDRSAAARAPRLLVSGALPRGMHVLTSRGSAPRRRLGVALRLRRVVREGGLARPGGVRSTPFTYGGYAHATRPRRLKVRAGLTRSPLAARADVVIESFRPASSRLGIGYSVR